MRGLVAYLVGPGKANEHSNPRLVAGSEPLYTEFADATWDDPVWSGQEVKALAQELNRPMINKRIDNELPVDRAWVMHVAISMEPGAQLDMDMWANVARDYVREMELDGADGKAPCRWVAFHHGTTVEGNDHIHLAIMMIREDGTWASTWKSQERTQKARRSIEQRYGLVPAEQAAQQRDWVVYSAADAHRNTQIVGGVKVLGGTDNEKLRRLMLAAAAAAGTEAEYVRNLWSYGVLTRPRFKTASKDVVEGYSVALRPAAGESVLWSAAGKVHKSLTLGNIRSRYIDSAEDALDAAAMWRRVDPDVGAEPPARRPRPGYAQRAAAHLEHHNLQIVSLSPGEVAQWAAIAQDAAGAWSAVATKFEPGGRGKLSRAAESMLRESIRLDRTIRRPSRLPAVQGMAYGIRLMMQASRSDMAGWAAVLEQLLRTSTAIADAARARRELDAARYLLGHTNEVVAVVARAQASLAGESVSRVPGSVNAVTIDPNSDRNRATRPDSGR